MKERICKQLISFALVFSFLPSLVVGISPSGLASNPVVNTAAVLGDVFKSAVNAVVGVGTVAAETVDEAANMVSFRFSLNRTDLVSPSDLAKYMNEFNSLGWLYAALATNNSLRSVYEQAKANLANSETGRPHAFPRPDPTTGNNTVRPYIDGYGWLVDSNGNYPYCDIAEWNAYAQELNGGNVPATEISTSPTSANKWRYVADDDIDLASFSVVGLETLSKAAQDLGLGLTVRAVNINGKMVKKYYIYKPEDGGAYFCDSKGHPYAADVDKSTTAIENNWGFNSGNVTTIVGDGNKVQQEVNIDASNNTSDNSQHLSNVTNITAGKFYVVNDDGTVTESYIDNLYYDNSTNTYHADTYNYNYDITNNYYEINYYTYNIQYTYNNTYVTYIGSTAEYQPKEWALYYELPDGRSSADLTEEDIAGLSFQFADICNYKRSATDTSLRALYHFDGNVDDASYWSTQGSFDWNSGASITYMESNAFNGALYLDEKEHQFTITLPSSIGSQDFSLQWRYYQNSATTTDHNENYVSISGQKLLGWSEQSLYSLGSTKLSTGLSVGTWQELALVRDGGTLYIYHNGVMVSSAPLTSILNNQIVFYFGANSRAYSMLDEMRVVNFAVVKGGNPYTPTAVPYDTNNVLVLPGGASPVADEYYKWDTTIEPVFSLNCENPLNFPAASVVDSSSTGSTEWSRSSFSLGDILIARDLNVTSDGSMLFLESAGLAWTGVWGNYVSRLRCSRSSGSSCSVAVVLGKRDGKGSDIPFRGTYTLTVVGDDLTLYSIPLSLTGAGSNLYTASASFDFGTLSFRQFGFYNSDDDRLGSVALLVFELNANSSFGFRYIELVPGTQPNTGHEFVSCVYDSTELKPNTAAIQSTIPVKGYTVGGVRPTFPERGDVWMPAEGSRISGVYIYNGQAWEETNARYWTGKRWIPIYAFDLVTLQDMWDVSSSTGDEITPSITSEYGFWNWWKNQWLDFRQWLASLFGSGDIVIGPGGSSGSDKKGFFETIIDAIKEALETLIKGLFSLIQTVLEKLLSLVTELLSFIFDFLTETVFGGVKDFFGFFTDGSLFEFFRGTQTVPGEDGEMVEVPVATLPEGIATVFAFFSGVILALPSELRMLLIFGIAVMILFGVFKFAKS